MVPKYDSKRRRFFVSASRYKAQKLRSWKTETQKLKDQKIKRSSLMIKLPIRRMTELESVGEYRIGPDESYRSLPSVYLAFLTIWFISVCSWTLNTYKNRHLQVAFLIAFLKCNFNLISGFFLSDKFEDVNV